MLVSFTNKFISVSYFSQIVGNRKVLSCNVDKVHFCITRFVSRPIKRGYHSRWVITDSPRSINRSVNIKKILTACEPSREIMSFLLDFLINYYSSFDSVRTRRPYRFSYLARDCVLYIFERRTAAASRGAFEKRFYVYFLRGERTWSAVP